MLSLTSLFIGLAVLGFPLLAASRAIRVLHLSGATNDDLAIPLLAATGLVLLAGTLCVDTGVGHVLAAAVGVLACIHVIHLSCESAVDAAHRHATTGPAVPLDDRL